MSAALGWLGGEVLGVLRAVGVLSLVLARTVLGLGRMSWRELWRGLVQFGWGSLPLVLVTGALTGATVVVQTGLYVQRFNARAVLGWAAGYAVLWEFGPLLLGLMMAARLGARNAAELATMQVGGQLEGLRGIGLDPFAVLVAPRVVAMGVSVTSLAPLTFLVAVLFEAMAAYMTLELPLRVFFDNFGNLLSSADLLGGVLKTSAFGVAIAVVSTGVGLRARGGARAVGQAAAGAVVWSCATIFLLDFLLTAAMTRWLG
ncbi:MAG TPA: ABC transporter permease [Myxococcaceae bacterium]|nr:ABC transporter permease [Myxococcaceae bacterium]